MAHTFQTHDLEHSRGFATFDFVHGANSCACVSHMLSHFTDCPFLPGSICHLIQGACFKRKFSQELPSCGSCPRATAAAPPNKYVVMEPLLFSLKEEKLPGHDRRQICMRRFPPTLGTTMSGWITKPQSPPRSGRRLAASFVATHLGSHQGGYA